jgi:hypothetical protein
MHTQSSARLRVVVKDVRASTRNAVEGRAKRADDISARLILYADI